MGLKASSGGRVNFGSPAGRDNLPSSGCTFIYELRRDANGTNFHLFGKDGASFGGGFFGAVVNGGGEGQFLFYVSRATTDVQYETAAGAIPLVSSALGANASPTFLCIRYNPSAGSGQVRIHVGSHVTQAAAVTFATSVDGAGAYVGDAANDLWVCNIERASTLPFGGPVNRVQWYTREISDAEMWAVQKDWSVQGSGCVLNCTLDGTGTQTDTTGTGDGTIVGTVSDTNERPLPQYLEVTNSNIDWTKNVWGSNGGGSMQSNGVFASSTFAQTVFPGAQWKTKLTVATAGVGHIQAVIDTSMMSGLTANKTPIVIGRINGLTTGETQLVYNATPGRWVTLASGLAAGTYEVEFEFIGIGLNTPGDRWNTPAQAVKMLQIKIDDDASLSAPTLPSGGIAMFLVDSIGECAGARVPLGTTNGDTNADQNDTRLGFHAVYCFARGKKRVVKGMGGIGIKRGYNQQVASSTNPSMFGSTAANRMFDRNYDGSSALNGSGKYHFLPEEVFVVLGPNDSGSSLTAAEVGAAIDQLRDACDTTTKIYVIPTPVTGTLYTTIEAGVALATQQTNLEYLTLDELYVAGTAHDLSSDGGIGGSHANVLGHAHWGAQLTQKVLALESGGSSNSFGSWWQVRPRPFAPGLAR